MKTFLKKLARIGLSYYEEEETRTSLGFLPFTEHVETKTDRKRQEIIFRLEKEKKLSIMALAEFYELMVKDKQKAINEYQQVIADHGKEGLPGGIYQAPFTVETFSRIRIAVCYQSLGQYEKAIEYYQYGYPWFPFHFEIAECYRLMGEVENAKKKYLESITFNLANLWGSNPLLALRAALILGDKEKAFQAILVLKRHYSKSDFESILVRVSECLKNNAEWMEWIETNAEILKS
jgi:tetratricopeptide (TPR) repeat protein